MHQQCVACHFKLPVRCAVLDGCAAEFVTRVSCRLASRWSLSIDGTLARHTASWRGHRGGISTRTSRHVYPWIARRWPGPSHARKMPLWCGTKVELQCTPSLLFHGQGDEHGSVTHASHDKRGDDTCSVHTLWHGVRRAVRQDDALIRVSTASHGVSSYRYLEVEAPAGPTWAPEWFTTTM